MRDTRRLRTKCVDVIRLSLCLGAARRAQAEEGCRSRVTSGRRYWCAVGAQQVNQQPFETSMLHSTWF